jgi:cAMP phosphodiesterase
MDVHILGTHPGERSHRYILTTYVVNGELAVDAGALGIGLTPAEQQRIHTVLLTHSHMDHVATLPIFIDNRIAEPGRPPTIIATSPTLEALRRHVFNDVIWPDLQRISSQFYSLRAVAPHAPEEVPNFSFHFFPVTHPVPTCGVVLEEKATGHQVLFTSDTTVCDSIWVEAGHCENLRGIFIEVSFPNAFESLAASSGHLTPSLLGAELKKLARPVPIYLTHYKSIYVEAIREEIKAIRGHSLHICLAGELIHLE